MDIKGIKIGMKLRFGSNIPYNVPFSFPPEMKYLERQLVTVTRINGEGEHALIDVAFPANYTGKTAWSYSAAMFVPGRALTKKERAQAKIDAAKRAKEQKAKEAADRKAQRDAKAKEAARLNRLAKLPKRLRDVVAYDAKYSPFGCQRAHALNAMGLAFGIKDLAAIAGVL